MARREELLYLEQNKEDYEDRARKTIIIILPFVRLEDMRPKTYAIIRGNFDKESILRVSCRSVYMSFKRAFLQR